MSQSQLLMARAYVLVIERAWIAYRNRRVFKLLKHAIRAAENFLALDILRRVAPKEAQMLNDPCTQVKVRLRFGGCSFPPLIYFKVYVCNKSGQGIKYMTGKRLIRPYSSAARSACSQMGARTFLDQLTVDTIHHNTHGFTDEIDVSTLKDYMKYTSVLDETPAYLGGRDNPWRQLTLQGLPRHVMFYDVVDFIYSHKMSAALCNELPLLLAPPVDQSIQLEHIRILSQYRSSPTPASCRPQSKLCKSLQSGPGSGSTSRRSQQARQRALKMRSVYQQRVDSAAGEEIIGGRGSSSDDVPLADSFEESPRNIYSAIEDDEGRQLYEWTQTLTIDDFAVTPRIGSS